MKTSNNINNNNNNDLEQSIENKDIKQDQKEENDITEKCPKLVDTSKLAIIKSLLSTQSFDDLKDKVSEKTLNAIREMNFTHMTEIQSKSIIHLLEGKLVFVYFILFVYHYHYIL